MRGGSPEFSRRQDLDGGDQGAHHGHGRQVGPQPPRGGVYRPDGHAPGPGGEPGGDDVQRDGEDDHAGTCSAARGNWRSLRSDGVASGEVKQVKLKLAVWTVHSFTLSHLKAMPRLQRRLTTARDTCGFEPNATPQSRWTPLRRWAKPRSPTLPA